MQTGSTRRRNRLASTNPNGDGFAALAPHQLRLPEFTEALHPSIGFAQNAVDVHRRAPCKKSEKGDPGSGS
jgi:hypothetical protein